MNVYLLKQLSHLIVRVVCCSGPHFLGTPFYEMLPWTRAQMRAKQNKWDCTSWSCATAISLLPQASSLTMRDCSVSWLCPILFMHAFSFGKEMLTTAFWWQLRGQWSPFFLMCGCSITWQVPPCIYCFWDVCVARPRRLVLLSTFFCEGTFFFFLM